MNDDSQPKPQPKAHSDTYLFLLSDTRFHLTVLGLWNIAWLAYCATTHEWQWFMRSGAAYAPVRELIFEVREAAEGGYVGRALGDSICVEADDWATLERQVRDAVACHFEDGAHPALVRLHFVRDEVLAV